MDWQFVLSRFIDASAFVLVPALLVGLFWLATKVFQAQRPLRVVAAALAVGIAVLLLVVASSAFGIRDLVGAPGWVVLLGALVLAAAAVLYAYALVRAR